MSENTLETTTNGFFDGFTDLLSNKHFWMVIFVLTTIATGYYYYSTYINKSKDKIEQSTDSQDINNQQIQDLINKGVLG